MLATGVLIDNSAGNYTPTALLNKLNDFAESIDASTLVDEEVDEVRNAAWVDELQVAYELELDLIDRINAVLTEHGLCLTVGEIEPSVYLIERLED